MLVWENDYKSKTMSAEEAVGKIKPNDKVFYSYGSSCPFGLVNAVSKRLKELGHIDFYTGMLGYPVEYLMNPEYKPYYDHYSTFYFQGERMAPDLEKCHFFSFPFSRTEWVFQNMIDINVMMFECTPPDEEGYMNYGCYGISTNDYVAQKANIIIAQVNTQTPYIYGERNKIHVSKVNCIVENDHPLVNIPPMPVTDVDRKVAEHIVNRIADGSNIQIGVGGLANAVCTMLDSKKDLGVYSEMFVDAMVGLINKGVINNSKKTFNPGKINCTIGGLCKETYDFINRNDMINMYPMHYMNDPKNIAQNDNMVSINNTLMADLTGQACSETIGFKQYSGTGGQLDFVRGSQLAKGGQSFIALPSTLESKEGLKSRIALTLPPGEVITVPRADVDQIVTEYGVAELKYKTIAQRVKAMISVAHPQFRDELTNGAKKAGLIY